MMDIDNLKTEYSQHHYKYEKLKEEIKFILEEELKNAEIPYHLIESRVKSLESVIEKVQRIFPEKKNLIFDDISDICGIRIICLFLSDINKIGKLIEKIFRVYEKDDKILSQPQEDFGYLSVHYVCSLPSEFKGPRYDQIKDLRFEIQIRTIAMHSWATISHYLDYKSAHSIPSHLRKDFYGLNALFFLADSHFELFFRNSEIAKKIVEHKAHSDPKFKNEEINLNTLSSYLKREYPDRPHVEDKDISEVVEELIKGGYSTINDLDKDLKRSKQAFIEYEKEYPALKQEGGNISYKDIGVVRISLLIANPKMEEIRNLPHEWCEPFKKFRKYLS